jgi:hypothetical protein
VNETLNAIAAWAGLGISTIALWFGAIAPRGNDVTALWPKMPVSHLHLGQSLPLTLSPSLGTRDPRAAVVKWRDGRDGEQLRRFDLSYNRVAQV